MKALVNYIKFTSIIFANLICIDNIATAQTGFKTFKKNPTPIVRLGSIEDTEDPYSNMVLDYHDFKEQGESPWSSTKGNWYLKYKKMYDFRCKEPFQGGSVKYTKNNYLKSGYLFRLVDNQIIEDSIQFLLGKYLSNNADTLKRWNLPLHIWKLDMGQLIKRLGQSHFKFVLCVFDHKKYSHFLEVPEAEQANDNMVYMKIFKYPADVDILLYNFQKENWEYVESLTVSGDHELELYILQKFEPRYLENCNDTKATQ
jgi:hypothetical protein